MSLSRNSERYQSEIQAQIKCSFSTVYTAVSKIPSWVMIQCMKSHPNF